MVQLNYNVHQAKTQLSKLLEQVSKGARIIISRSNKPIAILSPIDSQENELVRDKPKIGIPTSGKIVLSEDAFAPLSEDELKDWNL